MKGRKATEFKCYCSQDGCKSEEKKGKWIKRNEKWNEMNWRVLGVWVDNSMAYGSDVSLSGRDMPASTGLGFFFPLKVY